MSIIMWSLISFIVGAFFGRKIILEGLKALVKFVREVVEGVERETTKEAE